MQKQPGFKNIGGLILKALKQAGMNSESDLINIQLSWARLVGDTNAEHSYPYSLDEGELTIKTSDERWQKIFKVMNPELIESINQGLKYNAVRKIRIQKSKILFQKGALAPGKKRFKRLIQKPVIDDEIQKEMSMSLSEIQDPELRAQIERIWKKDIAKKQKETETKK